MLKGVAIERLVADGLTKEQAKAMVESLTESIDLKRIYSIRLNQKSHTIKVEATHLSPEDLFKEAFLYMTSIYIIDHKEYYKQNPAKVVRSLKEKIDLLQLEACREANNIL